VEKLRERISVSKRARQIFDDIEVKETYQVEISNRFAV
jgi:hypothetical protein